MIFFGSTIVTGLCIRAVSWMEAMLVWAREAARCYSVLTEEARGNDDIQWKHMQLAFKLFLYRVKGGAATMNIGFGEFALAVYALIFLIYILSAAHPLLIPVGSPNWLTCCVKVLALLYCCPPVRKLQQVTVIAAGCLVSLALLFTRRPCGAICWHF